MNTEWYGPVLVLISVLVIDGISITDCYFRANSFSRGYGYSLKKKGSYWTVFAMAGVPSTNKMYRTSAFSDVHAAVHFAQKTGVYTVYFAKDMYTLLSDF